MDIFDYSLSSLLHKSTAFVVHHGCDLEIGVSKTLN